MYLTETSGFVLDDVRTIIDGVITIYGITEFPPQVKGAVIVARTVCSLAYGGTQLAAGIIISS
ncbi:MAG: hypothetical protein LBC27_01675 [Spirochaetaceae bacterium]|nr:hypothetical protein [Spirochaetaceae bacterium]